MTIERKIRVLLAKPGLDGHDLGIKLVARAMRDAGMEVIYMGLNVTPEETVAIAIQESVDVIGVSYLSGSHLMLTEKMMALLRERSLGNVKVVVGGIIPQKDIESLKQMGVAEIFRAGTSLEEITNTVKQMLSQPNVL